MSEFLERLDAPGPPLLLDGGMGSMLIAAGLPAGFPPERWNEEQPEKIIAIHRAYVEAGSEAVHTNTFGCNPVRMDRFGLSEESMELNRAAVRLARASGARFVIGDIGPTGQFLPPVGAGEIDAWRGAFLVQAQCLASVGVDAYHIETMSDIREAHAALDACKRAANWIPVMVSLTFERKRRGCFTVMGNEFVPSLRELDERGAAVVGANCSITSEDMLAMAEEHLAAIDARVVLQPNAGQPRVTADGVVYDQTPEAFAADVAAMAKLGARAVGGCCGTDPSFISALRERLDPAAP